jgi:Tol biopolymer transport system component
VNLSSDPAIDERPAWLPDGSGIVFASDRGGGCGVWKVPVLGGRPSLLVRNAKDPAVSPDGSRLAFVRTAESGEQHVWAGPLSDPDAARQVTAGPIRALQPEEDPAWSPDGRWLCYSSDRSLWTVSTAGGTPTQLTRDREYDIEPAWASDGRSVYFSSYRDGVFALWQVAASGGTARRLTRGPGPERHPSASSDGTRLAFSTFTENIDLVTHDLVSGREERLGTTRDEVSPAFSHDGRWLVYVVDTGPAGGTEVWLQPIVGGRQAGSPHRLAETPGAVSHPEFSPDDKWVAFQRTLAGSRDIWMVPAGGGMPTRVTDDPADDLHPVWSPDGRSIAFVSLRGGSARVWIEPVADGRPAGPARQLTSGEGTHMEPAWSSDGSQVAYLAGDAAGTDVWVVRSNGSGSAKRVTSGAGAGFVRWEPRSSSLMVSGAWGGTTLTFRTVDPSTGQSRPVGRGLAIGPSSSRPMFDISGDGRMVVFSRGNWTGDIFVAEVRRKQP